MCHVVLMMPLLGLAVFWIWPASVAVPVYTVILLLSAFFYAVLIQAMGLPVQTGREGLVHEIGEVVSPSGRRGPALTEAGPLPGTLAPEGLVRVHGELWAAVSTEPLGPGDRVEVVGLHGLTLQVKKVDDKRAKVDLPTHCG